MSLLTRVFVLLLPDANGEPVAQYTVIGDGENPMNIRFYDVLVGIPKSARAAFIVNDLLIRFFFLRHTDGQAGRLPRCEVRWRHCRKLHHW
jgi:hypothetical protein